MATATATLPALYRVPLTTIEPIFAAAGAFTTLTNPASYIHTMTGATIPHNPRIAFLFPQLCGAWLLFAFNEAVLLRVLDDLRVWRLLCAGMLLSDIPYVHSCAQALGGWAEWVRVSQWGSDEWIVMGATLPFILIRLFIVLGLGVKTPEKKAA
jgi:hypothetical protein